MFNLKLFKKLRSSGFLYLMYVTTILFSSSCTNMNTRDYNYIEKSLRTYNDTILPTKHLPILIKAKSDSEAYLQACLYFNISIKYYNKEFKVSGTKVGKPLSFRLLNKDSVDIAKSLKFNDKQILGKNIERQVTKFELEKEKDN